MQSTLGGDHDDGSAPMAIDMVRSDYQNFLKT
jgi:hypothetical protein